MKVALYLGFLFLLTGFLHAADITYDISKFNPTDLMEYNLTAGFSTGSGYNFTESDHHIWDIGDNINLSGAINKQRRNYSWGLTSYDYSSLGKSHNVEYYDKSHSKIDRTNGSYETSKGINYKRYFHNLFLGGNASGSYVFRNNDNRSERDSLVYKDNERNVYLSSSFSASLGMGRLYQCQEAYLAWYVYKELDKNNCLNRQYGAQDIDSLAYKLYEIRTLYGIDPELLSRKKTTILLEYIKSTGNLKQESEIKAYAILLQLWGSIYKTRLVGAKIELNPTSSMDNYWLKRGNESYGLDQHDKTIGYGSRHRLKLTINYERPINNVFQLRNQFYIQQAWINGFSHPANSDSSHINWAPYTHLDETFIFTYYPDYRTELGLNIHANFKYKYLGEYDSTIYLTKMSNPIPEYDILLKENYGQTLHKEQQFDLDIALTVRRSLSNRTTIDASLTYEQNHLRSSGYPIRQNKDVNFYTRLSYRLF